MSKDVALQAGPDESQRSSEEAPLEIHRPKPIHGWREFAKEVGIIVLGVLIALTGEQGVEWLHWHHAVEASGETLRDNARVLIAAAAQREAMSPCVGQKLETIGAIIDDASSSGRIPAVHQLGAPGVSPFDFSSWDNAVAAEVTPHLTREQMGNYASVAFLAASMREATAEEMADWADLYTIVGPGRRFGDAEQARTRGALSRAVLAAKRLRVRSEQLTEAVAKSGLLTRDEIKEVRKKAGEEYAGFVSEGILMCKPLEDAPAAAHYGQAPSPVDLSQPFRP